MTEGDTSRAKCYLIAVRVIFNKWLSFGNALLLVLNTVREHICLFVVSMVSLFDFLKVGNTLYHVMTIGDTFFSLLMAEVTLYHLMTIGEHSFI